MRARIPLLVMVSLAVSDCAHECPGYGPEPVWAKALACYDHTELDDRAPTGRAGCYRLALGPSYLTNASTGTRDPFIENPEFVELTAVQYMTGLRSGYLARTPPRHAPWVDKGVWWPTREGGAFIDLGNGFFGMLLRMRRSGFGYSGTAETYQDVGDVSQKATADLWPVSCDLMPAGKALRSRLDEHAEGIAVARYFLDDRPGGAWKAGGYEWLTAGRMYWVRGPFDADLLVAVLDDGRPPVRLTARISAVRAFLSSQFDGRLPGAEALVGIAQLAKDGSVGHGGSIATRELLESKRHDLGAWLRGRERNPAEFERLFSGIRGSLNGNEWTLEFNVINGWGGVDLVKASGTASPLTLREVSIAAVKPRGEFYYPLEG